MISSSRRTASSRQIDSVDYFTNRRLLDAREENAPFKVERIREDRYFIFFFDKPATRGAAVDQLTQRPRAACKTSSTTR